MARGKAWTIVELNRASKLWKEGDSIDTIAEKMNRGRESIKHQSQTRRDLFPRRKQERFRFEDKVNVKIPITAATHKIMKAECEARGISMNMLIRETLKHRFVRKTWKLPENTSIAKVKYFNGSREV